MRVMEAVAQALLRAGLSLGALVCLSTTLALAQEIPQAELFGGYSYLRGNPSSGRGFNSTGWDASLVGNPNRWLGVELNLSDHYGTSAEDLATGAPVALAAPFTYAPRLTFLFGPHFSFRSASSITPFAHALFGGVQGKATNFSIDILCGPPGLPCRVTKSQTALAVALGGGIDLKVTQNVAIRLLQADYLHADFVGNSQNNARFSAGIVLTFGRR